MSRGKPDSSMSNDSFSDGAPSSDYDPYQNEQNPVTYHIDYSHFPKPIPIFGRLFGYNDAMVSQLVQRKLDNATKLLNRPVTQDEATALAYFSAKQVSIMSYGSPAGLAGGLWRCYATIDTFQFPFFKPDLEKFRFDKFPSTRAPVLRDLRAIAAWHMVRAASYSTVGITIGNILFGSYAASVTVAGEMLDTRLKTYVEAIRERQRQNIPQGTKGSQPQTGQTGTISTGGSKLPYDQSPAGIFGQADMTPSSGTYDSGVQVQPQRRQWPLPRQIPPQAPQAPADDQAKPFDMFDGASPTSGQGMMGDITPAQPQGSAWERLRRGEKPAAAPSTTTYQQQQRQTQREQRDGSTIGDGYTFSRSDEERSYAKEEAQKEFDARIELERRGGDFNAGNKRW
ncbi:uncharacterized protein LY89DRAFT_640003 [Mollisia scopiformis]|uniref:Uncharacterized protein n=1 Tax=Mollisia scopiformis TaxID=149040 RepID=A0A194XJL7_MOLSC|nr:uncharacterized protein LY89DRAFT_640003 [Mollisia scopiformis]KUJ20435.1 hypothetical protein LY89DRAFT_640003 [Mollisia scopiformis]